MACWSAADGGKESRRDERERFSPVRAEERSREWWSCLAQAMCFTSSRDTLPCTAVTDFSILMVFYWRGLLSAFLIHTHFVCVLLFYVFNKGGTDLIPSIGVKPILNTKKNPVTMILKNAFWNWECLRAV